MAQIPLLTEITTRHQVYLERLKTQYSNEFDVFLVGLAEYIKKELGRGELTDFKLKRLNALLDKIGNEIDSVYSDWFEVWRGNLEELAVYESGYEERAMLQVMEYEFNQPTRAQLIAAINSHPLNVEGIDKGKLLQPFFADYTKKTKDRITGVIRQGYATGQTNAQIRRSIIGTVAQQNQDGDLARAKREASLITRTAVQDVAMTARQTFAEANPDIIKGYKWVATLDSRTSAFCRATDGQVFKVGKGPLPPAHYGCRSSISFEVDSRLKFLKKGATRPSRGSDGVELVPQSKSYYAWLKNQSDEFVATAIKDKRLTKLFLDGGLSAERFAELQLNKRFEPLTLEQMKQLEPLAFKRAGLD